MENKSEQELARQLRAEQHKDEQEHKDKCEKTYIVSSHTNALTKISGAKLNIILVMLTAIITYFAVSFYYSSEPKDNNDRKIIWFDRQRVHPSESFAKVDEQFPAGYEIWDGKKLIERWHWKIENDPRTHQFGDFIFRCVAKYSNDGAYIGYTEYQMSDYPTEQHEEFESLQKKDAIVFHLSTKSGFVTLSKPTITAKWKGRRYMGAEKITDGFPHSKNQVHASMLIENKTDMTYVEWLAERFKFLQKDVVNAYLSKKDFEDIIENAPEATQAAWSNFVDQMNSDCEQTQAYIDNKRKNRKIEGTVSK